jgi:predicted DNA-binding protein
MQKEYVTTNVRLPQEAHRQLKLRAFQEEKSLAELIREAIFQRWGHVDKIVYQVSDDNNKKKKDFLQEMLKLAKPMGGKISTNIDNILYGKIRRRR